MKTKKIIIAASMIMGIVALPSCKKDKTETPVPSTPSAPVTADRCTAKINGVDFNADSYGSSILYPGVFQMQFYSGNNKFIDLEGDIQLGNHTLGIPNNHFQANYVENNVWHYAKSGSMNITQVDSALNNFVVTFNFSTDTLSGQYYTVTNGNGVYKKAL